MIRAVVSLSGGLDSTVLLHHIIAEKGLKPEEILVCSFHYGSRHNQLENVAAENVRQWFSIPLLNKRHFNLGVIFDTISPKSALLLKNAVDQPIPEGHYNDETMRQTVVPGRNLMFTSVLAALAEAEWQKNPQDGRTVDVYLGVHQGDHFIYPDCRPAFVIAAASVVFKSSDNRVVLSTPFLRLDKKMIVAKGLELGTPFGLTRTCYTSRPVACGKCGSCRERIEAFQLNGRTDFIEYEKEDE